ncbi:glycosyltransferase [Ochrobactrum sp. XJ1]|nr:glycosyltransferase [Ochrobactrum sp. XJ1]
MHSEEDRKKLLDVIERLNVGDEYFWVPDRLVPFEHWVGHIPFIFWLMKVSKPARSVELGTHSGNSYCAMCQAVSTLQIGSVGTAVDTWLGDIHMEREDGLFEDIRDYHDPRYSTFSTLLRATFDQARPYFGEASIDLLHIDGTHTYEAVKNDFETWKSAMSDRGIVLFHDTEVRRDDFGVWKLWDELSGQYPSFGFQHSNGLGVIAVGENLVPEVRALFESANHLSVRAQILKLFSTRGAAFIDQVVHERVKRASEEQIASLNSLVEAQRADIEYHRETIERLSTQVYYQSVARAKAEKALADILTSTSWLLTGPVRNVLTRYPKLSRLGRVTVKGSWWALTGQLPAKMRARRAFFESANKAPVVEETAEVTPEIRYIPHYIDPNPHKRTLPKYNDALKLAVHVHLENGEAINLAFEQLRNVPVKFDLFLSIDDLEDVVDIRNRCVSSLNLVSDVYVEPGPSWGFHLAGMVEKFGTRLCQYDIVGHFHLAKSFPTRGGTAEIDTLLGGNNDDKHTVGQIFELLQTRAKAVFTEEINDPSLERDDAEINVESVVRIVERYSGVPYHADDVYFSRCSGFWANVEAIREFLEFPITSEDLTSDGITSDVTIAAALDRLLHVAIDRTEGDIVCLYRTDSVKDYRFYENQEDFTSLVENSDVKVLSYYLPQFHPTPENDEWHGKGFTEWTKVRATNPLFEGHYQQHIPHSDVGYYYLDSADTLRLQADQMNKSGVYGQIFYHYWFGGRLILEEPVRMLLNNKDIPMRFCFCWANENWTKRWDGNESEILLGQNYSPQDAEAFIRYLIPFFRDERYINVDGRPVLFVYRPSHIDSAKDYVAIWRKICVEAGLKEPYVVAVLTRGATNPAEFDMDAGVERVLHDWTDGSVPEMKHTLNQYVPMKGSVLSYPKVAEFYGSQLDAKDFTYLRSVVPMWDNTPRYNDAGIMLHGGTPQDFQSWLEDSIGFSRKHLPLEERFVVVNAWNEWAEGAHLEPDTRHGYAYLNSIGRALVGKSYSSTLNEEADFDPTTSVVLSISDLVVDDLRKDPVLLEKFVWCINNSTIFDKAQVSISSSKITDYIEHKTRPVPSNPDFIVEIRSTCLFEKFAIELLIRTANKTRAKVIPNFYGDDDQPVQLTANGSVEVNSAARSPIIVIPQDARNVFTNVRMRTDARCFFSWPSSVSLDARPAVTTIIRVHNSAAPSELRNALYSLFAIVGCDIVPLIVTQDFTQVKKKELELILAEFRSNDHFQAKVIHFYSPDGKSDIRSKLLNEGLRAADTRYAAFLDYDDLLLPIAYEWLIDRLQRTGKAISFGRVYTARYDTKQNLMFERLKNFEYGYSYEEFINNNHAPLHSFIIDLEKIDISMVKYFDNHKYMEDYYLTLQIVTKENTDWDGLRLNKYIGDYVHATNRRHTLAISCDRERSLLAQNEEYLICRQRILDLRNELICRQNSV